MRIRYSTEARDDLAGIILYGNENFGPAQPSRYVAQIRNAIELIGLNPEMARLRTELERPVRTHTVGAHMVVFGVEDGVARRPADRPKRDSSPRLFGALAGRSCLGYTSCRDS